MDEAGASHMRDVVAKMMWTSPSLNLCTVVTGSCLALLWQSVGLMPPNGTPLIALCRPLDLPAEYSQACMQASMQWRLPAFCSMLAIPVWPSSAMVWTAHDTH